MLGPDPRSWLQTQARGSAHPWSADLDAWGSAEPHVGGDPHAWGLPRSASGPQANGSGAQTQGWRVSVRTQDFWI
jgi:hypothetical protein